jgi:hypothetical protein
MFVFVALIMVGFFYVWKKGALNWAAEKAPPLEEQEREGLEIPFVGSAVEEPK